MNKPVTLSINPTYLCNFRCDFCYLTPAQLADPLRIDVDRLREMLAEVLLYTQIDHIDVYGGEITALPRDYVQELFAAIREVYSGTINVVTNFLRPEHIPHDKNITLSVSYDFHHRERHEQVWRNIEQAQQDLHVLVLATPGVLAGDVDQMISQLNTVSNIRSVEIKPYSSNQANQHSVPHTDFEQFISRWITSPVNKQFEFTNEYQLKATLAGRRSSFSDDHLYITPAGRFAVLDFDLNDNEFFLELDTIDQYIEWTYKEKQRTIDDSYCIRCEYFGVCLTEHLRKVKDVTESCNGYYKLITWYKNERLAAQSTTL